MTRPELEKRIKELRIPENSYSLEGKLVDGLVLDHRVGSPKNCSIQKYSFIIGFSNILSTIPRYTAGLLRQRLPTRICG